MPSKRKANIGRSTIRARAAKVRRIQESDENAAARRTAQTQRQAALRKLTNPEKPSPSPTVDDEQQESPEVAEDETLKPEEKGMTSEKSSKVKKPSCPSQTKESATPET